MAIAQYSDTFWFPSGVLASAVTARVFLESGNTLATLYTDATGTTALPNPLNTDAFGMLTFYAEEGEYWIHIDTESFRVSVGSPNLDVFEVAASSVSTGVISGGHITVNAGNPSAIDITEMVGYVVDHTTDPFNPTATRVHLPAQTVAMDAAALARVATWWLVDVGGNIIQQEAQPDNSQRRSHIVLGLTAQDSGVIFAIDSLPVLLRQPVNQLADLMDAIGPFNVSGNQFSPNGANLMVNHAAGLIFSRSFNYVASTGGPESDNPHVAPTIAQAPAQWRYGTRTIADTALSSIIDPTRWDNNGVLSLVGGGSNSSTVQRIWMFPTGVITNQLLIQYGQVVYSNLSAAVSGFASENFVPYGPTAGAAALVGCIAVTRTATNLSDPLQATFIKPNRFARQ